MRLYQISNKTTYAILVKKISNLCNTTATGLIVTPNQYYTATVGLIVTIKNDHTLHAPKN